MIKVHKIVVAVLGAALLTVVLTGCSGSGAGAGGGSGVAKIENNVQTVVTQVGPNSYSPITVKKGVPVRWSLNVDQSTLNNCNGEIMVPQLGIQKVLQPGENIVEFTPGETGAIPYMCWMGMIHSQINVVDEL